MRLFFSSLQDEEADTEHKQAGSAALFRTSAGAGGRGMFAELVRIFLKPLPKKDGKLF